MSSINAALGEIITDSASTTNFTGVPLWKRVRSGVAWSASSSIVGQVIGLIRSIVIARLLIPEDFGLLGMALTVIAGLTSLTTIGLDHSIVSNKFADQSALKSHLNTVWSAELVRSLIVALLVILSAYPLAIFYGQPRLRLIIPVLSLNILIQGFQNIGLVILRKEIGFARIFWYELASHVSGIVVTIGLVLALRNVWSLVVGLVTSTALSVMLSYAFHSYRPRLSYDKVAFQRAMTFGKFALVIAVASYITTMADNIMVGRLLGTNALGNYALAYNLASVPIGMLVFALGRVLFPAYAEIAANRPQDLERVFIKVFTISSLILITVTVPIFLLAREIVQLLFGPTWATAGSALKVLSLIIPLRGLTLIISMVFFGLNRPKQVAAGKILEAIVFLVFLYPLILAFGVTGAAWAGIIAYAFACINRVRALREYMAGIPSKLIGISLLSVAAAGAAVLIASITFRFVDSALPRLIAGGLISMVTPALFLLLIRADLKKWIVTAS
ncbi:MAG TPA: lipopolysaccharide biosynthesis protein [Pyrinomonadaceae bacterium]